MSRELIEHDPLTGMSLWFEPLESEKKFRIHHTQDVAPALERNKLLQNANDYKKAGIKSGFQHFAHIPDIVVMQWWKEGIDVFNPSHIEAVKRKLRDPEYRHLRTTLGGI